MNRYHKNLRLALCEAWRRIRALRLYDYHTDLIVNFLYDLVTKFQWNRILYFYKNYPRDRFGQPWRPLTIFTIALRSPSPLNQNKLNETSRTIYPIIITKIKSQSLPINENIDKTICFLNSRRWLLSLMYNVIVYDGFWEK